MFSRNFMQVYDLLTLTLSVRRLKPALKDVVVTFKKQSYVIRSVIYILFTFRFRQTITATTLSYIPQCHLLIGILHASPDTLSRVGRCFGLGLIPNTRVPRAAIHMRTSHRQGMSTQVVTTAPRPGQEFSRDPAGLL